MRNTINIHILYIFFPIDLVDRSTTPRMPWHDIGAVVVGASARDIARHFIQRWNAVKLEKARENPVSFHFLFSILEHY